MSTILDQFGKPATYLGTTGASIVETTDDSTYRAPRPRLDNDIALLLPKVKHRALLSDSRWIRTAFPIVGGFVKQKADYVCGSSFKAQFTGTDTEYGTLLEAELAKADKLCDLRGFPYDFNKCMHVGCQSYDFDGDWFIYATERRDLPGYPAFQFIEAHRIGSNWSWSGRVQGGVYDGAVIINGIIYDDAGAEIAYNLLGRGGEPDRQIPASDMLHAFDPRWFSEGRALPSICYAILDWYDVKQTRDAEKIAQAVNATLTLIEETATGRAPVNNATGEATPATPAGTKTELMEKGLIRYVKSGSGKITAHASNRPSAGAAAFEDSILAGAFYGADWRREMMDLAKLGGAGVRGFQDNINTVIFQRWGMVSLVAYWCRLRQIAKLTARGDLPAHPEWMKVTHAQPADFTVDAQRTSQTDRDNVRAGVTSMPAVIRRNGGDAEDILREQARYLVLKKKIAQEEGVSEQELGTLMLPGDQNAPGAVDPSSVTNNLAQPDPTQA